MIFNRWPIIMGLLLVATPFITEATGNPTTTGEESPALFSDQQASPAPGAAIASVLTEKPWRLRELKNEPLTGEPGEPYLLFTKTGDLLGFGGCNYFVGKYRSEDSGKIVVSSLRASHKQCPEAPGRETTLLTSLVLTDSLQADDTGLTFSLNGNPLMKLAAAPDLSVDELRQQGKLLKKKNTRPHKKTRSKKKNPANKAKTTTKNPAPKAIEKNRQHTAKPAKSN